MAFWNAAQSSNDCEAVRAYMQRFPRGVFIELAKLSERRLCVVGRKVTIVDPASSPGQTVPPTAVATLTAPGVTPAPSLTPAPAPVVPAAIAALPEVKAAGGSTEYKPTPALSRTEMTRTIQLELYRVGCGINEANGYWTAATREGLRKYNKVMHAKLDLNDPSSTTITALQNQDGRVCPVECGKDFVAKGNTCVAVAKPRPEPRAEPRRKERRVVERRRAPRAAAKIRPRPPHPRRSRRPLLRVQGWCPSCSWVDLAVSVATDRGDPAAHAV